MAPDTLKSTKGINSLCRWLTRPLWSGNDTSFSRIYDQSSADAYMHHFDTYLQDSLY